MTKLTTYINKKTILKMQVFSLHFFLIISAYSQKQFEVSLNIGKANTWAVPSPSKYILYNKSNLNTIQYVNWKLLYTFKKYFQVGIGYNNASNCLNFNFLDKSLTKPSQFFGGFTSLCNEFNQFYIPIQANLVTDFFVIPYCGLSPSFSYSRKRFIGTQHDSKSSMYQDTIVCFLTTEGLKRQSFGYLLFGGIKVHLFKRILFKIEAGYSYTQKVFTKATLDYVYNGVAYNGVDFKFHNSFTYYTIGISYKFKLFKEAKVNK